MGWGSATASQSPRTSRQLPRTSFAVARALTLGMRQGYKGAPRPQPHRQEVLMADLEPLIARLAAENPEFRALKEEHVRYEVELRELNSLGFLTADQQWRVSELKKLKLMGKDRMESMIRHARDAAHA